MHFQITIQTSLSHILANSSGSNTIPISQFLKTDMTNKVIVAMEVPAMTNDYMVRLYKVAQRVEVNIL